VLFSLIGSSANIEAKRMGRAAFLDPAIFTVPLRV
jgi:hypothetical protein